jgi:hypothetical protein
MDNLLRGRDKQNVPFPLQYHCINKKIPDLNWSGILRSGIWFLVGAGEENRTPALALGRPRSTIELHPQVHGLSFIIPQIRLFFNIISEKISAINFRLRNRHYSCKGYYQMTEARSMRQVFEYLIVFLLGASAYCTLEILFRGFTHWTMFIAGGLCFTILYHIFNGNRSRPLWKYCLIGALIITCIEFLFGCIFNLVLGWNVWDYSSYPLHFMGQICLAYTLLWFLLSVPILWIARGLKRRLSRYVST